MRNIALVFCFSALVGAGIVACGDDSSSTSAAEAPSSESSLASSSSETTKVPASTEQGRSEPAEGTSSSVAEISSETFKDTEPAEGSSSSEVVAASSESAPKSSSSVVSTASSSSVVPESSSSEDEGDGICTNCDSFTAADPELTENGGKGSVTTYGSITAKETSLGGACNYGQTNIQYYAAIHVNVSPGDNKGPWQGGLACGGCVRVKAKTPDGWKRVTVRITDRCPDADCGVDLGGAPASDIMGIQVGRYYGEWEFVSCEGVEGVWGDSTSLFVKDGANAFWSVIQVRNPRDMVRAISIKGVDTQDSYELQMFSGAENFWVVPEAVLQTDNRYRVIVSYRTGEDEEWNIKGTDLAVPEANVYRYKHRE